MNPSSPNRDSLVEAAKLWSYMSADSLRQKCDAVVVCCSYDLRVCDHACELIADGYSDRLLLSGKSGNWTRDLWNDIEAEVFKRRALDNGIDAGQIIIEPDATNFGENIRFARQLLGQVDRVTFVTKPNSLLRVKLTVAAQWPQVTAFVSAPRIKFPDQISDAIGLDGLIDEMVGDVDRIRQYPESGFQLPHELPAPIIDAWQFLVAQGYTGHLLAGTEATK